MDKLPYSTKSFGRFPQSHNRASVPTPLYSCTGSADYPDGASPVTIETPLVSPNSHALLLLCFSIGNRASISALWTDAVPVTRGKPVLRSPGAKVR